MNKVFAILFFGITIGIIQADELEEAIKLQDAQWVVRSLFKKDSFFYVDSYKYGSLARACLQSAYEECETAANIPIGPREPTKFGGHCIKVFGLLTGIYMVSCIEDVSYRWTGVVVAAALVLLGVNDFRTLREVKYEQASKKFDQAIEINRIITAATLGANNKIVKNEH